MQWYTVSTQELMYYVSIITATLFFLQSKFSQDNVNGKSAYVDITKVPSEIIPALALRGLMGFFSDIFTFLAYNYTSFGKTQAIFFTNTLMLPFFALCLLKE